jgi:hypothetical protein
MHRFGITFRRYGDPEDRSDTATVDAVDIDHAVEAFIRDHDMLAVFITAVYVKRG